MRPRRLITCSFTRRTASRGFSLIEVMVVMTVVGVLVAMSVPSFQRAVVESQADMAIANLRAIWAAERLYWLQNHEYAPVELLKSSPPKGSDLLGPEINTSSRDLPTSYYYEVSPVEVGGTLQAFTAKATPNDSRWQGSFDIDQNGQVTGSIVALDGRPPITPAPAFQ
jgi:prepilin-type N-terminal cleavage/methylation domain-containing protein